MRALLTPRQSEVLSYVAGAITEQGRPPTMHEISAHFHWASPNAALTHVKALIRKKYLDRLPGIARGLKLAQPADEEMALQIIDMHNEMARCSALTNEQLVAEILRVLEPDSRANTLIEEACTRLDPEWTAKDLPP